jgi:uncharacterized repeat protein (TIGR04138 family)
MALGIYLLFLSSSRANVFGELNFWLGWANVVMGVLVIVAWFRMFFQAVQATRHAPVDVGVIDKLRPLPPWPDLALADAVLADGNVMQLTVHRAIVDQLLKVHDRCEVLFFKMPRPRGEAFDTGCAVAARVVLDVPAPEGPVHWTGLPGPVRLELRYISRKLGRPIDAIFFVVAAVGTLSQRKGQHVAPQEICQYIPEHAMTYFGHAAWASQFLSAWDLRTGDDVGAIVMALVESGLAKAEPGESIEDFKGIGQLAAPGHAELKQISP